MVVVTTAAGSRARCDEERALPDGRSGVDGEREAPGGCNVGVGTGVIGGRGGQRRRGPRGGTR